MSSVDNRIVNMQFNNKQFQSGAAQSAQALDSLEKTIGDMGTSGGLDDMGNSIDEVASRFSGLQIAGVAALATIASEATQTALSLGANLLGSITSTIFGAGTQRAIDIQQAKFQFRGLGLDVKEVMQNATDAVTGTAYGLQEAASLATQFGGSGVKAGKDMTTALRATSGIAAQTGRSYSEIGQIMSGISGTGKLNTEDLIQFGIRGLDVTGALADEMGKTQGQIHEMVSNGQIDFKTFAKAMDDTFGKNATKANQTFTGALANMKAALSRLGAEVMQPMIKIAGDLFNLLKKKIDAVHEQLKPLINAFAQFTRSVGEGIMGLIKSIDMKAFLNDMIHGFRHIVMPIIAIFNAIGDAWSQVFPDDGKNSGKVINNVANAFRVLTVPLKWIAQNLIPKITPAFVLFFSALKVGWAIVSGLYQSLTGLAEQAAKAGGSIVSGLLSGISSENISGAIINFANSIIQWIKETLGIHSPASTMVPIGIAIVQGIGEGILKAYSFVNAILVKIGGAIIEGFKNLFGGMDALDWTALFNAILTGGVLLAIRSFVKTLSSIAGTIDSFTKAIDAPFSLLTKSLEVMQAQVRVELVKAIAIAVALLTASIIALSLLDPKKAAAGLTTLAAALALMVGTMSALSKFVDTSGKSATIVAVAAAIVLISGAMVILAGAIAILGHLPTDEIGQGMTLLALGLALMVGSITALADIGPSVALAATGLFIVASAMSVLAVAIVALGHINPDKVGQGMTLLALGLALMVGSISALSGFGPATLAAGASLYVLASALVVMAGAIALMSAIGPEKMSQGFVSMGVGLGIMVAAIAALTLLGPEVLASAAAIIVVAEAMLILATALKVMGGVGPEKMSQGLTTMAVALGIFLVAAAAAEGVAVGLVVLAGSMLVFGAGVALLGVGLLAAASAFAIFTAVLGAGTAAIIAGLGALFTLLPLLAQQLALAFVVFVQAIAAAAPELRTAFGEIIKAVLGTIKDAIPHIKSLAIELISALLDVVTKSIPKFGKLLETLIKTGLKVIRDTIPDFIRTGIDIIVSFLEGLAARMDKIITAGGDVIVAFIKGLGSQGERIVRAAAKTIGQFVDALPPAVHDVTAKISGVGFDIAIAIAQGIYDGLLTKGMDLVRSAAENLANALPEWMQKILGIASPSKVAHWWGEMIVAGLVLGITDHIKDAVGAAVQLANAVVAAGDKVVAKAQTQARKAQIAAERRQARADVANRLANQAEKAARQSPKNKELQQAAKDARKIADAQQKAADAAQKRADAQSQHVQDVQAFRDADAQGKGNILTDRADVLADRAIKKLAEANAEAQAAKKATGKERQRLQREARKDAQAAKRLADQSKADQKRASEFFAQSVKDRIKSINEARRADAQQRRDQEKFDNATDEQKVEILRNRADAAQKRSEAAQKQSEALVKQARKIAKTDAVKAQKLLDRAENLAQKAQDSADEAKQDAQDADSILNQGSSGTAPTLTLSKSAMEDAASAVDRMTKSLLQAEEMAAAAPPVIQFVQTNTSPESLSAATVYRQTKNLLSAAEIKMAGTG